MHVSYEEEDTCDLNSVHTCTHGDCIQYASVGIFGIFASLIAVVWLRARACTPVLFFFT